MKSRILGHFTTVSTLEEPVRAFVPAPLPPNPPLALTADDHDLLEKANRALGRLDGILPILPDPDLFLYFYVRKEALLSSQIEGTQSSFTDLLLFESDDSPSPHTDDVREVSNYVDAMAHGLARLDEGLPLSNRLLREIHAMLMSGGRGSASSPGEFRHSQNWIGGSRPGNAKYVPPPPHDVPELMGVLEKFLHDEPVRTPLLIKVALAHVQFESIHPFLDGNGRLGRLLITLLMCVEGALSRPVLYLSLYLKNNRDEYYDLLQLVRTHGAWEAWLRFFLRGIIETAGQAFAAAQAINLLFASDRKRIEGLGRVANSALRVHQALQSKPITTAARIADAAGLSLPTALTTLSNLEALDIVVEITGRARSRMFTYAKYLAILESGTEPLPR